MPVSPKVPIIEDSLNSLAGELSKSRTFREYEVAFQQATGLPLVLTAVEDIRFALCSKHSGRNLFCQLMTATGHQCETCRLLHQNIEMEMGLSPDAAFSENERRELGLKRKTEETVFQMQSEHLDGPRTFECFAGLCETMVPVKVKGRVAAYLQTGQVLVHQPSKEEFEKAASHISCMGVGDYNFKKLEEAYFQTPILPPERYHAMVQLLNTFALHLSEIAYKTLLEKEGSEPVMVKKARQFIEENFDCPITLEDVSCDVGSSTFHFSKVFKKTTGLNFTEFLARYRVEKAKELLYSRNKRINEVAFDVGFQSLAPFNRSFRKYTGETPREFRDRVLSS